MYTYFLGPSARFCALYLCFRDANRNSLSDSCAFTDSGTDNKPGAPKRPENNNSVFASDRSPENRPVNGVVDNSNSNIVDTPDLSPVKQVVRNGEVEDIEIRKTKAGFT